MRVGSKNATKIFPERHELYTKEFLVGIKFDIRPMEEPPQTQSIRSR